MSEDHATFPFRQSFRVALVAAASAVLLVTPAALARPDSSVSWASPTKANMSHLSVKAGSRVTFALTASTSIPEAAVSIQPVGTLPPGAALTSSPNGSVSRATFRWTPSEAGEYTLRFGASAGRDASAPVLTYVIGVTTTVHDPVMHYPLSSTLTNSRIAQWAPVLRRVAVHTRPSASAPVVTTLGLATADGAQDIVLALESRELSPAQTWYRVRLPILPNNSTGWVPANAIGDLTTVHTHLYVDLAKLTATLMLNGRPIFRSIVGVGHDYWPTPRGEFYIRMRATNFHDPFYGPVAFGTSARSAVLTDWPAGGFVGVHGTNQPAILPGRVSHGCIRMPNASILKLAKLMPIGTPLTVR